MNSNTKITLEDAIKNAARYIEEMQLMDDKQLSKNLDLFRQQMAMAYQQKTIRLMNYCENTKLK